MSSPLLVRVQSPIKDIFTITTDRDGDGCLERHIFKLIETKLADGTSKKTVEYSMTEDGKYWYNSGDLSAPKKSIEASSGDPTKFDIPCDFYNDQTDHHIVMTTTKNGDQFDLIQRHVNKAGHPCSETTSTYSSLVENSWWYGKTLDVAHLNDCD